MPPNIDFWARELSRSGLPAPAQQELLQRLAWTIDYRTKYFPDSPPAYVDSMKVLLLSTFLPRKGQIVIENAPGVASGVLSRGIAWELAYLNFPCWVRKIALRMGTFHATSADVICPMARNDFPLAVPPRWLTELFEMVNRVVSLKMLAKRWPLEPSSDVDPAFVKLTSPHWRRTLKMTNDVTNVNGLNSARKRMNLCWMTQARL